MVTKINLNEAMTPEEHKALADKKKREKQKKAREYKKWSSQDIAKQIKPYNMSLSAATSAVMDLRYKIKSTDEWANMEYWDMDYDVIDSKSWGSISAQATIYETKMLVTIDTGYYAYQTTVPDATGWYTE